MKITKRIIAILTALLICTLASVTVFGANSPSRLVDDANLLTSAEESALLSQLNSVSEKYGVDVVIVTVNDIGYKTPMVYADDYYDNNGYGEDGVLLLISMADRDWYISTAGLCISAFSSSVIESIGDEMSDHLSDGDYADAFEIFIEESDCYIDIEINGVPFNAVKSLLISLVIGFVIALISVTVMKGKLKSVHFQSGATSYLKSGSLKVTDRRDIFLYRNVTRRARPQQTRSGGGGHISSSGRSHGGGGGKF